ncbi:hypothetical protein ACHQM5_015657 [Ranunculus cassubicifolius]
MKKFLLIFSIFLLLLLPVAVYGECTCDVEEGNDTNKTKSLSLKIGAITSILFFGAIGVSIPILSKIFPAFEPGKDFFYMIKAFAAGVILATGFIHVLPEAFERLTSPCLKENPWGNFPFTGFIAMMAAIGGLVVDTVATSYYERLHLSTAQPVIGYEEENGDIHGSTRAELIRHRVISHVLELGIVVHSVIIGISLGASDNSSTVKTLLIALSFHQFFEGMGLGGCISQAKFKVQAVVVMSLFFALTTPIGIAIGIGISNVYKENSPTALIVEGVLDSASAGILVYMALVDLLAADFMSAKVQGSMKLLLEVIGFLLLGVGLMSTLAMWA